MNRMRMALLGLILALGLASLPLANTALAQSSGGTKSAHRGTDSTAGKAKGTGGLAFVASVLGVTPAVLQTDLAAGQTLLQIAGSKFASADDLATALLAPVKTRLDAATTAKKLTATQSSTLYTQLHSAVAKLVVTPHPKLGAVFGALHSGKGKGQEQAQGHDQAEGAHLHVGLKDLQAALVSTCNTSATALKTAITTGGKTLLAICQVTNPSVTQSSLVAALLAGIKTKLDTAVTAKTITAAQETTQLSKAQTYLNTLVTTTIPARGQDDDGD